MNKSLMFSLYNLYILYSFLDLGHKSLGFFFVKVHIVRVVIELMEKYHLNLKVMPYYLMFRNLVHIYQN
jgi:hypothetical protein